MTTPLPGEEPPVGESLWVDAEWWRAMSDADPASADAAAGLTDPLTDPLPTPDDDPAPDAEPQSPPEEPEAAPLPEPDPEPAQPRSNDLHVPRVLPEPQPDPPAPARNPPPTRAPRVQAPVVPPPPPGSRRRAVPALSGHLADLLLLLLALGVIALVYVALTR